MSIALPKNLLLLLLLLGPAGLAVGLPVPGDFDGNGIVDAADTAVFKTLYGQEPGDPDWNPTADLDGSGRIDLYDLALLGATAGTSGDPDTDPPAIFVTLNDIPDDQNDLLVVPPEGFQITVDFDSLGGSLIDLDTVSIVSDRDFGAIPPGNELAGLFQITGVRAFAEVQAGTNLDPTSHYLTVTAQDLAGNPAQETYGFAVRDFGLGAPFSETQTVFFDFDQDRSLGAEVDLLEDLREFGLSSTQDAAVETTVRDLVVAGILTRARDTYGQLPDGSPGTDPVNIVFTDTAPGVTHARLCIGGSSTLGGSFLGAAPLDPENLASNEDTCPNPQLGVFPQAIDNLWGTEPSYLEVFSPVDPDLGGTPIGENPIDAAALAPGFVAINLDQFIRFVEIHTAIEAFTTIVGTVAAHETGHLVGLVAHGDTPAGLYGGTSGGNTDHNVVASGPWAPVENFVMNRGPSFNFDEISGRNGFPLPAFRPLSWAYLHDRVALNQQVTGLFPAPTLDQVTPNPAAYGPGEYTTAIQVEGTEFLDTPVLSLRLQGGSAWASAQNVTWVSSTLITATINAFVIIPGVYDVRVQNPDGQQVILTDHLVVVQQ